MFNLIGITLLARKVYKLNGNNESNSNEMNYTNFTQHTNLHINKLNYVVLMEMILEAH